MDWRWCRYNTARPQVESHNHLVACIWTIFFYTPKSISKDKIYITRSQGAPTSRGPSRLCATSDDLNQISKQACSVLPAPDWNRRWEKCWRSVVFLFLSTRSLKLREKSWFGAVFSSSPDGQTAQVWWPHPVHVANTAWGLKSVSNLHSPCPFHNYPRTPVEEAKGGEIGVNQVLFSLFCLLTFPKVITLKVHKVETTKNYVDNYQQQFVTSKRGVYRRRYLLQNSQVAPIHPMHPNIDSAKQNLQRVGGPTGAFETAAGNKYLNDRAIYQRRPWVLPCLSIKGDSLLLLFWGNWKKSAESKVWNAVGIIDCDITWWLGQDCL